MAVSVAITAGFDYRACVKHCVRRFTTSVGCLYPQLTGAYPLKPQQVQRIVRPCGPPYAIHVTDISAQHPPCCFRMSGLHATPSQWTLRVISMYAALPTPYALQLRGGSFGFPRLRRAKATTAVLPVGHNNEDNRLIRSVSPPGTRS